MISLTTKLSQQKLNIYHFTNMHVKRKNDAIYHLAFMISSIFVPQHR